MISLGEDRSIKTEGFRDRADALKLETTSYIVFWNFFNV